ncbi:MAG: hypothetical protein ABIR47_00420 [Candidatus Kapaibacterium sp.]
MGGNALKTVETRRYSTAELERAIELARERLEARFPGIGARPVKWFSTKETHGDLDLLVFPPDAEEFARDLRDALKEDFGAAEIVRNGDVWSFNFNDLQVDLVVCRPEDRDIATAWYSYNDLSVLVGRIYRFWHLKWSPRGLFYPLFAEGTSVRLDDIFISKDVSRIFAMMGYDYEWHRRGFSTMDDVFRFIASSEKFSRECCDPKYMSNDVRVRDNKRVNVQLFDEWLRGHATPDFPRPSHRETIAMVERAFPESHLGEEIARLEAEHSLRKDVSARFNGRHIIEEFGLEGKAIGEAMAKFRNHFGDGYNDFILANDYAAILAAFRNIVG